MTTRPDTPTRSDRGGRTRPDRREQLIDHAAELFLDRGYGQVSVADIAKAAGVTGPAVYRHFPDKQALLVAAIAAGVADLERCTERATDPPQQPAELITVISGLAVRKHATALLWRGNSSFLTDEQNQHVAARTRAILRRWSAVLFVDRPELTDRDIAQLAWSILSVTGSLSVHATRVPTARARPALAEIIARLAALTPSSAPVLPLSLTPVETTDRRGEILDAAARLFAARGFASVGVDDIGAAVGITGPSVYKHFPSKAEILVSIGRRSAARLEAGAMAAHAADATPAEVLSRLADSYVTVLTSTPDLSVGFANRPVLRGLGARDLVAVQRDYVTRWIDLLDEAHGDLGRPVAAVTVHAALTIANDAVQMGRNADRDDFPAQLAYLVKGALGIA
ncbi:TetR/AcrR family transcriptional regulator [Williamsia sterculiae]|uniref:Transcriptional regulator, TetR family n=1 Tax=Williamsia sterculiae TaxID=1344003 RepID=A0A1N7CBG8_9NOCA|nr:TetR/AcrR family transcriptional regulator [Williamsia sterculiae]SIR60930.1 transcriptional regulator, TetR family [Williamsia sterculiae]